MFLPRASLVVLFTLGGCATGGPRAPLSKEISALPRALPEAPEANEARANADANKISPEARQEGLAPALPTIEDDGTRIWVGLCYRARDTATKAEARDARRCRELEVGARLVGLGYRAELAPVTLTLVETIADFGGYGTAARFVRDEAGTRSSFVVFQSQPAFESEVRAAEVGVFVGGMPAVAPGPLFGSVASPAHRRAHLEALEAAFVVGMPKRALADVIAKGGPVVPNLLADVLDASEQAAMATGDRADGFRQLARARLHFMDRDFSQAARFAVRALDLDESLPFARNLLARSLAILHQYHRAATMALLRVDELDGLASTRPLTKLQRRDLLDSLYLVGASARDGLRFYGDDDRPRGIAALRRLLSMELQPKLRAKAAAALKILESP